MEGTSFEVGKTEAGEAFVPQERDFESAMSEIPDFDERAIELDDFSATNDEGFDDGIEGVDENAEGFASNNARAYNSSPEYMRQFVTPEKMTKYDDVQRRHNVFLLKKLGRGFLADAYKNVVQEYPQLLNVRLVDKNIQGNAFFESHALDENGDIVPQVSMNFQETDTYLRPETVREGDNFGMDYVLNMIALKTGARPSDIMRNERLVSTFVMMHELGHALDFKVNYLDPARQSGLSDSDALIAAVGLNSMHRLRDMMGKPIPGQVGGNLQETSRAFRNRLRAFGIDANNMDEVVTADKASYREMSSESYADEFAANYIMRHYDDFFEQPDRKKVRREKIVTQIGETLCVTPNIEVLGLRGGRGVRFTLADMVPDPEYGGYKMAPVPGEVSFGGFLNRAVKAGEPMSINLDGDPINGRVDDSTIVQNAFVRYYEDKTGKVQHETYIQTIDPYADREQLKRMTGLELLQNSILYKVETVDEEPREIGCSIEEMTGNLRIGVGSKVMLMKQALDPSTAHLAQVRMGDFIAGVVSEPIQVGKQVILEDSALEPNLNDGTVDPDFMIGGNTSRVVDMFRKWNSYYLKTENSIYEVIPYK